MSLFPVVLVAFLATTVTAALARAPAPDGGACPGCVDNSSATASSGCPLRAGANSILLTNSGACWDVDGGCGESYPCTPRLTVYVASTEAATVLTNGYIGTTGTGGVTYNITDPTQLLEIYDDYTEVACGACIDFEVGANLVFSWDNASCYIGVGGTLLCSSCGD